MSFKIPDNLSAVLDKINKGNQYYVLGGLILFVFLFDYFLLMRPQLSSSAKASQEIKKLAGDFKKAKEDLAKSGGYQKEVDRLKEKFESMSRKVKSKEEVSLILERVSRLAYKNGIKIDQMVPNSQEIEVLVKNNDRSYSALPILVEAKTGYHNLGKFINDIERDDMFLTVDSFTISTIMESRQLEVQLTLKAIVFE